MKNLKTLCLFISFTVASGISGTAEPRSGDHFTTGEKRNVGSFNELDLGGAFTVTLVQGNEESVIIDASAEVAAKIITKVVGNELQIDMEKNFNSNEKIALTVNFKSLKSIDCSGAGTLTSSGKLQFDDLTIEASGAYKTTLELSAKSLSVDISGAGNTTLSGNVPKVDLEISGTGKFTATSLQTEDYEIDISGTGNAEINASKSLDVEVSGTGVVKYSGEPVIKKEISGTGKVVRM